MDTLPSKLNASEILSLYSGRRVEQKKDLPDRVDLEIQNREAIPGKLKDAAKQAMRTDREYDISTDGVAEVNYGWDKRALLLSAEVLDGKAPLTVTIEKGVARKEDPEQPDAPFTKESILVYLYHAQITGDTPEEILESRKSEVTKEKIVGGMIYNVQGNAFTLRDRQIYSEYRRQGLGSMALKCSEAYIHERANEKQVEQTALVDAAQVDVICWLWNNGYRPRTGEDQRRLEQVLEGDSSLCIGENLYVFDQSVPPEERTADHRGIDKALRIHFEKKLHPKESNEVSSLKEKTASAVQNHIDL